MSKDDTSNPSTLSDDEIVSAKKISRRSLLASTGIGIVLGATALVAASAKKALATDAKTTDTDIPSANVSDPDRD